MIQIFEKQRYGSGGTFGDAIMKLKNWFLNNFLLRFSPYKIAIDEHHGCSTQPLVNEYAEELVKKVSFFIYSQYSSYRGFHFMKIIGFKKTFVMFFFFFCVFPRQEVTSLLLSQSHFHRRSIRPYNLISQSAVKSQAPLSTLVPIR